MQTVTVRCRAPGLPNAPEISVEVHVGAGLPGLTLVGLVETAVRESRDRVRAALQNSGFVMPDRRILVSLAPADLPKSGSRYDLAIAVGILCASGQAPLASLDTVEFTGELGLSGTLRSVPATLPVAMAAVRAGRIAIVPAAGAGEAGLLNEPAVLGAGNLAEVCAWLRGEATLLPVRAAAARNTPDAIDLADVIGQQQARRALEIAAAGGHNLLFSGPPGTGKSMLAQRLPGILPRCTRAEALETAAVYSLRGLPFDTWPRWRQRPLRAPHHSATVAALAGGGSEPRPGEISLAHNGVLFLDELPEFQRAALEVLREPLETGVIAVARARRTAVFPAQLQLVAAMNPCPCGYLGDPLIECRCTPEQLRRYRERISGPLLDRIDLCSELPRETAGLVGEAIPGEASSAVRKRVLVARRVALQRQGCSNARLRSPDLRTHCLPGSAGRALLEDAAERFGLSRRACDRILRVGRTIADLAGSNVVNRVHVAEALGYRFN